MSDTAVVMKKTPGPVDRIEQLWAAHHVPSRHQVEREALGGDRGRGQPCVGGVVKY